MSDDPFLEGVLVLAAMVMVVLLVMSALGYA